MKNVLHSGARIVWVAAAATLVLSAGAPPTVAAQGGQARSIRAAIPKEFPKPDASALIVRYADPGKGDVIVLNPARLTSESFRAAVALLRQIRKTDPPADQDVVVTVNGFAPLARTDARFESRLNAILAQLRSQPVARVGNLGQGQWLEVSEAAITP